MKKFTPYQNAKRYISNAEKTLIENAKIINGVFDDEKYVQTAGGVAYAGVLLAIDEYLKQKEGIKFTKPKSIEEYRTRIAKQNKKLLNMLNEVYGDLHLSMYYRGAPSLKIWKKGKQLALEIIDYIK